MVLSLSLIHSNPPTRSYTIPSMASGLVEMRWYGLRFSRLTCYSYSLCRYSAADFATVCANLEQAVVENQFGVLGKVDLKATLISKVRKTVSLRLCDSARSDHTTLSHRACPSRRTLSSIRSVTLRRCVCVCVCVCVGHESMRLCRP